MSIEFVDYNGNDITSAVMQPNDNLLINSDFVSGFINQKNQTNYNIAGQYSLDMWQITGSGKIILKNDNKDVQFYRDNNIGGIAKFRQLFISNPLEENNYTLTVNIKSCTTAVKMYIINTSNVSHEQTVIAGINVMNYSGTIKEVGLLTSETSGSCYINFMKLEIGDYFTGMPAYNHEEELTKCMAYSQPFYVLAHTHNPSGSDIYYSIDTMFQVPMVKTPIVTLKKAYLTNNTDITSAISGTTFTIGSRNVGIATLPSARYEKMIKFDLWLDAYDYD